METSMEASIQASVDASTDIPVEATMEMGNVESVEEAIVRTQEPNESTGPSKNEEKVKSVDTAPVNAGVSIQAFLSECEIRLRNEIVDKFKFLAAFKHKYKSIREMRMLCLANNLNRTILNRKKKYEFVLNQLKSSHPLQGLTVKVPFKHKGRRLSSKRKRIKKSKIVFKPNV